MSPRWLPVAALALLVLIIQVVLLRRTSTLSDELERLDSLASVPDPAITSLAPSLNTLDSRLQAIQRDLDLLALRTDTLTRMQAERDLARSEETGDGSTTSGHGSTPPSDLENDPATTLLDDLEQRMEVSSFSRVRPADQVGLSIAGQPMADPFDNAVYILDDDTVQIAAIVDRMDAALPTDVRNDLEELAKASFLRTSLDPLATDLVLGLGDFVPFDTQEQAREYIRERTRTTRRGSLEIVPLREGGYAVLDSSAAALVSAQIARLDSTISRLRTRLQEVGQLVIMARARTP